MKYLIIYLFTMVNALAGFPPTTVKSQEETVKATTFNLEAPNYQATSLNGTTKLIETGNKNELTNPNFEHSMVTTGWTVSNATASGNTANPLEGKKSLSLALTGALSLSQSSTINAAQKSGVQMVASVWVNSSDVSDLRLCSLKNGAEDKCTVTGGYVQGSGWRQLTVSFLGNSTSNGLKLKSTDTTGTVLVDQAYVGIGSPVVDFTPDMVFSARVNSTGVVTNENTDWINGNCSLSTATFTCTFNSGIFTVAPNCVSVTDNTGTTADISTGTSATTSAVTIQTNNNGTTSAQSFYLVCQKQGADYKTSKAYVASSSDFGYTNAGAITITATTTNPTKGTTSIDRVMYSRSGSRGLFKYQFRQTASGTAGSGEYLFSLPSGLSFDTNVITPYSGAIYSGTSALAGSLVGYGQHGSVAENSICKAFAYDSTKFRVMCYQNSSAANASTVTAYSVGSGGAGVLSTSGMAYDWFIDAPIQGWTDSGVIVGSFQGYNETPGTSRVETFSVSYGTTNASTVCSASPCSYLDQIGNAVASITRSGTGTYAINTSKTYSKLKCQVGYVPGASWGSQNVINCTNCNTASFQTVTTAPALADSFGTLICQGIPQ